MQIRLWMKEVSKSIEETYCNVFIFIVLFCALIDIQIHSHPFNVCSCVYHQNHVFTVHRSFRKSWLAVIRNRVLFQGLCKSWSAREKQLSKRKYRKKYKWAAIRKACRRTHIIYSALLVFFCLFNVKHATYFCYRVIDTVYFGERISFV